MFSKDAQLMSKSSSHILVLGWYDSGKIIESSVSKKCVRNCRILGVQRDGENRVEHLPVASNGIMWEIPIPSVPKKSLIYK